MQKHGSPPGERVKRWLFKNRVLLFISYWHLYQSRPDHGYLGYRWRAGYLDIILNAVVWQTQHRIGASFYRVFIFGTLTTKKIITAELPERPFITYPAKVLSALYYGFVSRLFWFSAGNQTRDGAVPLRALRISLFQGHSVL